MKPQESNIKSCSTIGLITRSFNHFLLILLFLATSCKEDEVDFPVLLLQKVQFIESDIIAKGSFENFNPEEVEEFGVLWSEVKTPELENSFSINFTKDAYTGEINVSLTTIKPSTNYYIRIYCRVGNNIFYSAIQQFMSPSTASLESGSTRPIIVGINPTKFIFNDTIEISGQSFGIDSTANEVFFNQDQAEIINRSDTSITVKVPIFSDSNSFFTSGDLEIFVKKYQIESKGFTVEISPPHVTYVSQSDSIYSSYSLDLEGRGFHPTQTTALFGDIELKVNFIDENNVTIIAPPIFQVITDEIVLKIGPIEQSIGTYKIQAPIINNNFENEDFGPFKTYTLHGKYLDNKNLSLYINDKKVYPSKKDFDELTFTIQTFCEDQLIFKLTLDNQTSAENIIATVDRATPKIVDLQIEENNYYDAMINMQLQYFPRNNWRAEINGKEAYWNFDTQVNGLDQVRISVPRDVIANDGWLHLALFFCDESILKKDSVLFIPPPELSIDNEINSFFYTTLSGNYLGGQNKIILIDGEEVATQDDWYYIANDPIFKAPFIENGAHTLQVIINNRPSNEVQINVNNSWEKIGTLEGLVPELNTDNKKYPIAFLTNNMLFIGSPIVNDNSFFQIDLNTSNIVQLQDAPLESGISISEESMGYVFYQAKLTSYDYQTDTWISLPNLPDSLIFPELQRPKDWDIHNHSGFIEDNKFFYFTGCLYYPYFYYDLLENTWKKLKNGPSTNTCSLTFTFEQGPKNYLSNYRLLCEYDPISLEYSSVINRGFGSDGFGSLYSSRNGFYYQSKLFLYSRDYFETLDVNNQEIGKIGGPEGQFTKIIRVGDLVYAIIGVDIWKFDLTR